MVQRLKLLNQAWSELKQLAATRGQKLDESLTYQQFLAKLEEEEAWIRFVLTKDHEISLTVILYFLYNNNNILIMPRIVFHFLKNTRV